MRCLTRIALVSVCSSTLCLVATEAHAAGGATISSNILRYQNASGLTDFYSGATVQAAIKPTDTITNPSGLPWGTSWSAPGPILNLSTQMIFTPGPTYTASQVDAFQQTNYAGVWSASFGGVSRQWDMTSTYIPASQRNYLEFTSESAALWDTIVATNATGLFEFHLTQPVANWGSTTYAGSNIGSLASWNTAGDAFTMNITGPTAGSTGPRAMTVFTYGPTSEIVLTGGDIIKYSSYVGTCLSSVPAPGAIALLGMAGLMGRRRR